jgi:hypothetical protein
LDPAPDGKTPNWNIIPALITKEDSTRYVGAIIQASRAFKAEVQVFTNLGQFVNKTVVTIPQSEFIKLTKGVKNNTRMIKVLWKGRTADGGLVGTGAYILKTTVTLLKLPGIAEDESVSSDIRIVGYLRSDK